jgi:hypothetical protein
MGCNSQPQSQPKNIQILTSDGYASHGHSSLQFVKVPWPLCQVERIEGIPKIWVLDTQRLVPMLQLALFSM